MATTVTVTVDPDGTGDYTSLSAAEAGEQRDLVSADEIARIECISSSGTADTDGVSWGGWTTDDTHYIEVEPGTGHAYRGVWDASKYRLDVTSGVQFGRVFNLDTTADVRIGALQIRSQEDSDMVTSQHNARSGAIFQTSGTLWWHQGGSSTPHIFTCVDPAINWRLKNVVFDGDDPAGSIQGLNSGSQPSIHAYNLTIVRCLEGVNGSNSSCKYRNVVTANCGTGWANLSGDGDIDYCASEDATAPGPNSLTGISVTFRDAASFDYHIDSGATVESGVDLSADSTLPVTSDIDADTARDGWDIGADETPRQTVVTVDDGTNLGSPDYSSLSAAEAGEQRDLVVSDEVSEIECHPFTDNTPLDVNGWTVDSNHFVRIKAASGSEVAIPPAAGEHYQLNDEQDTTTYVLEVEDQYVKLIGIEVHRINGGAGRYGCRWPGDDGLIERCVFSSGPDNTITGLRLWSGSTIRNSFVYGWGGSNIDGDAFDGRDAVYENVTSVGSGSDGVRHRGESEVVNCLAYGNSGNDFDNATGSGGTHDYNASGDATAEGANSLTSIADPFADYANGDYHLASGAAPVDAATSRPGFSTDFDGDSRPQGSAWDIGADEVVSTGGQTIAGYAEALGLGTSSTVSEVFVSGFGEADGAGLSNAVATAVRDAYSEALASGTTDGFGAVDISAFSEALASGTTDSVANVSHLSYAQALGSGTTDAVSTLSGLLRAYAEALGAGSTDTISEVLYSTYTEALATGTSDALAEVGINASAEALGEGTTDSTATTIHAVFSEALGEGTSNTLAQVVHSSYTEALGEGTTLAESTLSGRLLAYAEALASGSTDAEPSVTFRATAEADAVGSTDSVAELLLLSHANALASGTTTSVAEAIRGAYAEALGEGLSDSVAEILASAHGEALGQGTTVVESSVLYSAFTEALAEGSTDSLVSLIGEEFDLDAPYTLSVSDRNRTVTITTRNRTVVITDENRTADVRG